ncbi:hypothetical protein PV366_46030, partial [Streptomyces ipomoeae]
MIPPVLSSVLPKSMPPSMVLPSAVGAVAGTASSLARSAAQGLTAVPAALPVVGAMLRPRTTPRLWRTAGGVQIETRHLGRPGTAPAARELEAALRRVRGVSRAEVNGTLGCVYVGCDPETDPDALASLVAAADETAEKKPARGGAEKARASGEGDKEQA